MKNIKRYAWLVVALPLAAVFAPLVMTEKPRSETYAHYYDRCLKPQEQPFTRDLTCAQDAQKFRSYLTTPEG